MPSALHDLLAKGGFWTSTLMGLEPLWVVFLLVLIVLQRRRLRQAVTRSIATADFTPADDPRGDRITAACAAEFGPLTGGAVGLAWLSLWWLVALIAALWSARAPLDLMRFNEPGYLDSLTAGSSIATVLRAYSSVLITRSTAALLGLPNLLLTLLALDQILFRPRTRLRDEIRRQWLATDPESAVPAEIPARAEARFSWTALSFSWAWLAAKGLGRRALLVVGLQVGLGILVQILVASGVLPSRESPDFQLSVEPTAWSIFWRPLLGNVALFGSGLLLAAWVGARGTGWVDRGRSPRKPPRPEVA